MGFLDTYGVVYTGSFDSIPRNGGSSDRYTINILRKNYTGNISSITFSSKPAIHTFLNDEPKPYLKGSELEVNLLSIDNTLPLKTFYSENDDEWKVQLSVVYDEGYQVSDKILFDGYLVQENCEEIAIDITHEIKLTFTDNLGYLKDIKLLDALKMTPRRDVPIWKYLTYIQTKYDSDNIPYFEVQWNSSYGSVSGHPEKGDIIRVENSNKGNGYYYITEVIVNGNLWNVYIEQEMPDISSNNIDWFPQIELTNCYISFFTPFSQDATVQLLDIYWICLYNTGIKLKFLPATTLNECSQTQSIDKSRLLEYICVGLDYFVDNNNSDTLDQILEKINYRFAFTLFQSDGAWCLVRWNELRNTLPRLAFPIIDTFKKNKIQCFAEYLPITGRSFGTWVYYYFDYYSITSNLTKPRKIGYKYDIESGLLNSIERPLKTIQHDFKYKIPDELIYNIDLNIVGKLVSSRQDGDFTIKRYEATGWEGNIPPTYYRGNPQRFIEVVYDQYDVEQERRLIATCLGLTNDQRWSYLQNYISNKKPIKINKGDILSMSWEVRADQNYRDPFINKVWFCITTDVNDITKYWMMASDGTWFPVAANINSQYIHTSYRFEDQTFDQWQTANFKSKPTPIDGIGFLCFTPFGANIEEAWYKSIEFSIQSYVDINKKTGHQHKTTIPPVVKNNEIEEIYIDDSLRNNISGTLLLNTIDNYLNKRTSLWNDGRTDYKTSLGELICKQEHLWKNKTRLKLEGNYWPIIINQGDEVNVDCLSMLSVLEYQIEKGKYLIFGKAEFDYKMNQVNFTAFEMWKNGEEWWSMPIPPRIIKEGINKDKDIKYTFKYLT